MDQTSGQRPNGSLRSSALIAQTLGLFGAALLAWLAKERLGLDEWHVVKAAVIYCAVMLIAALRLPGYHPFPQYGPANQVTTVRMAFVAAVAAMVAEPSTSQGAVWTAAASLVAALLDGLDGWLARRSRMSSAFGARFDMEVDALLIQALAFLVWQHGKAGPWVLLSGLMRYGFVVAGWIWPRMARPLPPGLRAKIICVGQIGALILAVLPAVTPAWSTAVTAGALFALGWSFFVDTRWLFRQARLETA